MEYRLLDIVAGNWRTVHSDPHCCSFGALLDRVKWIVLITMMWSQQTPTLDLAFSVRQLKIIHHECVSQFFCRQWLRSTLGFCLLFPPAIAIFWSYMEVINRQENAPRKVNMWQTNQYAPLPYGSSTLQTAPCMF